MMRVEILIKNGNTYYMPQVDGEITLTSERKGSPATLKFTVVKDDVLNFTEGNVVLLKVDDVGMFYGFVFSKSRSDNNFIIVTAYDQLRYFKNTYTYCYENKTASELLQLIANEQRITTGTIEDTVYKIAYNEEINQTLFDIILNALDETIDNRTEMYVLYDDFGKISLKSIGSMKVPIVIDEETAQSFEYFSSIDDETYNKIKLTRENESTGKIDVYVSQDSENINNWGLLQFQEDLAENENGVTKANALLSLYNQKTRKLSITKACFDNRVRAGCLIYVSLNLGDMSVNNLMLIEKCTHTFSENSAFMDLTLRGGEFIA